MKFFAVHDSAGNISRVVSSPPGMPPMLPTTFEPGQSVTEIALPEAMVASADPEMMETLLDVVESFRVEVPAIRAAPIGRKTQDSYE